MSASNQQTVITLVNGTWSPKPPWMKSGSVLRVAIDEAFVIPPIMYEFSWPGRNSVAAREVSAKKLAAQLVVQQGRHPTARHFVIGHSHGGNVALRAVEIGRLYPNVSIVCLSTPFFNAALRDYGKGIVPLCVGAAILIWLAWLWVFLTTLGRVEFLNGSFFFLISGVLSIPTFALLLCWKNSSSNVANRLTLRVPADSTVLLVRCVGDEASGSIGAVQFASWAVTKCITLYLRFLSLFIQLLEWLVDLWERYRKYVEYALVVWVFTAVVVPILAFVIGCFWRPMNRVLDYEEFLWIMPGYFAMASISSFIALVIFGLVASVAIPFLLLLIVMSTLPLGWEVACALPFIDVTIETTPLGSWQVSQVRPTKEGGFNHSASHSDPAAISVTTKWLVDHAKSSD